MTVQSISQLSKWIAVFIVVSARCPACTIFYPTFQLGPDFRVKVENQGHPVEGLRVFIDGHKGTARAFSQTDKNGFASFRGIQPGSYHVMVGHVAGISDEAYLEVKLDGPNSVTVPLKWPRIAPIVARSSKGTIHLPDYIPGQLQPRLSIDLLEAKSGRR